MKYHDRLEVPAKVIEFKLSIKANLGDILLSKCFPPLSPINKEKVTKDKSVEDVDMET